MYRIFDEPPSEYRIYGTNINDTMNDVVAFTLTPSPGGWDIITYYCGGVHLDTWGYLCILNNSKKPSLLRIGCTNVNPLGYVTSINNNQFMHVTYNLIYNYKCKNVYILRHEIYKELENLGFQPNSREGFNAPFDIVVEIIEWLGKKYEGSRVDWVN